MDIGIVHPELIYPRGAEKQVCKLAYNLTKKGHEVTIYTFEKKEDYVFDDLLDDVDIVSLDTRWSVPIHECNHARWFFLIKKLSKKLKTHDIINAHNHPAQWISKFTTIPVVWMCNEPPIWDYYSWTGSKKIRAYPLSLLNNYLSSDVRLITSLDSRMQKIIKKAYPNTDVAITGSGAELDRHVTHIENEYFDVLFVGALHPQKRPRDILNAFINIKEDVYNLKLHFVGEGALRDKLLKLSEKNNIDLRLYGFVDDDTLYNLYSTADLSVFVSEMQPWGIFPLESILAGIPTILSDQCGVTDILPESIPVIKTGNIEQLSIKILDVIENYKTYKENTKNVSELLKKNYSWDKYTTRMLDVFQSVL